MTIQEIRHGGWIQTYTGKAFYPMDPRDDEIDIEDIAHALSMLCRFAGHTERFYSIAEHCCHISDQILIDTGNPVIAFGGLMHDASEAYLVDIPKPVKIYLPDYIEIEKNLEKAIFAKYEIPFPFDSKIKEYDSRILITERNALLKTPVKPWDFETEPLDIEIPCWEPETAKTQFALRYTMLSELAKNKESYE